MKGIQVILILGAGSLFLYYYFHARNAIVDVLAFGVSLILAITFILLPNYTSIIAHKLGVGRGSDLLFYLCILLFLFITVKLFSRMKRMELTITKMVSNDAIKNAISTFEEKI